MNEQERIEEQERKVEILIENDFELYEDSHEVSFEGDFEYFKKEMLKLLLTDEQKIKLLVDGQSGWKEDALRRIKAKQELNDIKKESERLDRLLDEL